ncbi:hypothetical protein VP01_1524g4 [Puccinia sorghi]|uniref:Uncharacterized protein n=1 Tax=Puccinia sorghi TaxID=27349 RepID=A0A0L6VJA4_9BASI|nr:hypothetical protein VP01_1524g4 [Puccinia sorghi]
MSGVDMYLAEGSGPTTDRLTSVLNTLVSRIEEIAANLARLEKKVETLSSSTITTPPAKHVLSVPVWRGDGGFLNNIRAENSLRSTGKLDQWGSSATEGSSGCWA